VLSPDVMGAIAGRLLVGCLGAMAYLAAPTIKRWWLLGDILA